MTCKIEYEMLYPLHTASSPTYQIHSLETTVPSVFTKGKRQQMFLLPLMGILMKKKKSMEIVIGLLPSTSDLSAGLVRFRFTGSKPPLKRPLLTESTLF